MVKEGMIEWTCPECKNWMCEGVDESIKAVCDSCGAEFDWFDIPESGPEDAPSIPPAPTSSWYKVEWTERVDCHAYIKADSEEEAEAQVRSREIPDRYIYKTRVDEPVDGEVTSKEEPNFPHVFTTQ